MYRSVLCLIAFVGSCGVAPARLEASAATWFSLQGATLDGQPIDPALIDIQGGPGFPLGTALDITTMAGAGHYEFAVRFIVANRGFQRIGQWSLSLEADSPITLQSYQPTGPFLIPLGPLNTLPATGPGLVLDSAGQSSGGFPDGINPNDVAPVGLLVFSADLAAADFPRTHQLRAGIGQFVWATDTVFFADNPGIPGDATGTFAPAPILVIHQFIPEPISLAMFGIASLVIFRRKRAARPAQLAPATLRSTASLRKPFATAGMRHLVLCLVIVLCLAQTQVYAGRVHVKMFGTGQTGLTWDDAFGDIQQAIDAADMNPAIDEVWVAQGTYQPSTTCTGTRTATFLLANGVRVYGGFAGNETAIRNRAGLFAQTILSGDITGGDFGGCCPLGIALDLASTPKKLYWTDDRQQKIWRANLDGTAKEIVVGAPDLPALAPNIPVRVALDPPNNRIFWTEVSAGQIRTADLAGAGVSLVRTVPSQCSALGPRGLAFDLTASPPQVYWTTNFDCNPNSTPACNPAVPIGIYRGNLACTDSKVQSKSTGGEVLVVQWWERCVEARRAG